MTALEKLVVEYHQAPTRFEEFTDPQEPLPEGIGRLLAAAVGEGGKPASPQFREAVVAFAKKVFWVPGGNHFRTLGLNPDAGDEEISRHYRLLSQLFHPSEGDAEALSCRWHIREAYLTLKDPAKRGEYKKQLLKARMPEPEDPAVKAAAEAQRSEAEARRQKPKISPEEAKVNELVWKLCELVLDFQFAPDKYPKLTDPNSPLPIGLGPFLAFAASRVQPRRDQVAEVAPGDDSLPKAARHFVKRVLLMPGGSHYRALGVRPDASQEQVQDHYRYLRRLFWPEEQAGAASANIMRISEAYVLLRDPQKRRAYDRQLLGGTGDFYIGDVDVDRFSLPGPAADAAALQRSATAAKEKRSAGTGVAVVLMIVAAAALLMWNNANNEPPQEPPLASDSTPGFPGPAAVPELPEQAAATDTPPAQGGAPTEPLAVDEEFTAPPEPALAQRDDPPAAAPSAGVGSTAPAPAPSDAADGATTPEAASASPPLADASAPPMVEPDLDEQKVTGQADGEPAMAQDFGPDTAAAAPDPRQQQIDELLAKAQRQMDSGQYSLPASDNAYETFEQVIALDPGNTQARDGLNHIADRYANMARYRQQRENYDEAVVMISRGLQVMPDHAGLLALQEEVRREMEQPQTAPQGSDGAGTGVTTAASAPPPQTLGAAASAPAANGQEESQPAVLASQTPSTQPISEAALQDMIDRFVDNYEAGRLSTFMNLFAPNARTNGRDTLAGIRQDYEALFASSESRLMRLEGMRWNRGDKRAIGEADYRVTILKRGDPVPKSYEGRLTFQVVKDTSDILIEGLYHSQSKVER